MKQPASTGVHELLAQTDVLIDGPYVRSLNDGKGLRGSNNQRIMNLTSRLSRFDLANAAKQLEIHIRDREIMLIGIPPNGIRETLEIALGSPTANTRVSHERI